MARKTKEEAWQTRKNILDAAIRIFAEQGVSRTTLADIAKGAGVTRGAIYWHFKNKSDMLDALWEQLLLPLEPLVHASQNPEEADPLGKMKELFVAFFNSLADNQRQRQLFQILNEKCEATDDTGSIHQLRVNIHDRGLQRIERSLTYAVERGQLPPETDVKLGTIATICFIDGLVFNWTKYPGTLDLKKDAPLLLDGLLQMLKYGFAGRGDNDE